MACHTGRGAVTQGERQELERLKRVVDQTCSGHALLRDAYSRRALCLDLSILALGSWLVALSFVDPTIGRKLTPFGFSPTIWVGCLGLLGFFLGIVQLRVDWKARSETHDRSMHLHADLKRELGIILSRDDAEVSEAEYARVRTQEAMTASASVAIPDGAFLRLKRHHKMKVAISKHLDDHPGASIMLTKVKFILRDNPFR